MGSFVFKWPYAAQEVYVTGTFDDWSKSVKLDKVGDFFEKSVELPDASTKIYYKFVVDGSWVTDAEAPKEQDEHGNDNNVLIPEHIVKSAPATAALLTSAAPESTTAALAKDVPLEEKKEVEEPAVAAVAPSTEETAKMTDEIPGTFPETPATELDKEVKMINPLPAAPDGVNPVQLAPGEPIPEELKSGDINANVKLDPESYEKADAAYASTFAAAELPPVSKNMIPESSLPIASATDATISSAAPVSSTAALAAAVPLEKDKAVPAEAVEENGVPEIVTESQKEAGVDPEASGVPEEVKEKAEVEEELLKKVPEAPATSESADTSSAAPTAGIVAGVTAAAAGLGAAAVAAAKPAASAASETVSSAATQLPVSVKEVLPTAVQEQIATTSATEGQTEQTASDVPAEVKESIEESGLSPEAAANPVAVEEKKAVEAELLQKTPTAEPVVEAAPESVAAPVAAEPVVASSATPVVSEPVAAAVEPVSEPVAAAEAPVATEPVVAAAAAPVAAEPAVATETAPTATKPVVAESSAEPAAAVNGTQSPAALAAATAAVNASRTTAPASTTSGATSVERKKKHRFSGFFRKLLHKGEDKQ